MDAKRKRYRVPGRRTKAKFERRIKPRIPYTLSTTRNSWSSTWAFGVASTADFWRYYTFTPNDINGFIDYADVFDEFRINAIKVTFRPAYDSIQNVTGAGSLAQRQAYAYVLVDPSTTVAPTGTYTAATLNDFLSQGKVVTYTLNRPFSVYFKPKVSEAVFGGGTAARVYDSPWIKTSETGVQFRGFHMFLQQNSLGAANENIRLDTFYTFYVSFRYPK